MFKEQGPGSLSWTAIIEESIWGRTPDSALSTEKICTGPFYFSYLNVFDQPETEKESLESANRLASRMSSVTIPQGR